MTGKLYFICPTDYLESVITESLSGENYFFTSLGNSVALKQDVMDKIVALLKEKHITEINFVLSDKNRIVLDAIHDQEHSDINGLTSFYDTIKNYWIKSALAYNSANKNFLLFSYFLNSKISEMNTKLDTYGIRHIDINAKIYRKQERAFCDIYTDLICQENTCLN